MGLNYVIGLFKRHSIPAFLVLNLSKMILIFSNMPCHKHIGESFIQLPFGILIKLDAQVHVSLWNREQLMFAFFCISGY